MKEQYGLLKATPLMKGIAKDEDIKWLLNCIGGGKKSYGSGEILLAAGDAVVGMGIVLRGTVQTIDPANGAVLDSIGEGDLFLEKLACAGTAESPVKVAAASDCEVQWLQPDRTMKLCAFKCEFHKTLIQNMEELLTR